MTCWITVLLASGPARKALGLMLADLTIALFLRNLRRAGRMAERLSISERSHEIQRQMLEAASRRPIDRNAVAERLRDGGCAMAAARWRLLMAGQAFAHQW
jgi:hypothetical protein